ncbi:uncharacterized protein LOC109539490 [Dendroctonus ponderosae]|uniref:Uncharacterized protein n=1 Tax=Dendroctonus ponderosae TaxID=77166 RepID=A0AAR5PP82_DENPD|nr:uncharacterized protein LOC109539490 [Dendroctonus ponderosae]KAH1004350.1 hypothetical protein HUJ04_004116 [Dendroctonus ponderosae]KAH1004351.1 hypothetical protein HUJ04_004116 [Dendroctonus ponderosae]KAH1010896.1 hypothetical protein HUJ05_005131 [Dendroctonus ponderosae]KAH1010897.1 hypothetical protein HUJ05_005131 [Dendroctonus ponderosae]
MPGSVSVFLRAFLLCTLLCVVLAEGGRKKKDVHHMIVLNEDGRPPKVHRVKTSSLASRPRRKRKPAKPKARPASSEEEDSEEMHKAKSKKRFKSHQKPKKPQISIEDYSYADAKWNPVSSGEVFHKHHQPPVVPVSGSMHLGYQPEPMEITTSYSDFYSTAFPAFSPMYQPPNFGNIQQPYRPFDYSAGEPQNNGYLSGGVSESDQHGDASAVTPFSIVVASGEEKDQKVQELKRETSTKPTGRGKLKKGRGTSRFKTK